jgi:uncharacterized protein
MKAELPLDVDSRALLATQRVLEGTIPASKFGRLRDIFQLTSAVHGYLTLKQRDTGIFAEGGLKAALNSQCQRCLSWMPLEVEQSFLLKLDSEGGENERNTPDEVIWDSVKLRDFRLNILTLFEDELMLNLPMVPVHKDASCAGKKDGAAIETEGQTNPFSKLRVLLHTEN